MVLIRPVLGEPRMAQATPATSGGANSGRMLAAAIKPLNGVLVRTTIQENSKPDHDRDQGAAAAGDQRVEQRLGDIRVGQHGQEVGDREMAQAEALDHRIGVGERAEQQHQDRIDDQKAEDRQQQRNPQASPHAPTRALIGATHDLGAPAPPVRSKRFPSPATVLFLDIAVACAASLVDRAGGRKDSRKSACRNGADSRSLGNSRRNRSFPNVPASPSHTHHATACLWGSPRP